MAREFGRLKTSMWQRPKFHALSDDGKMLWLYLISCPHGNAIGAFVVSLGYMMADLRWQLERLTETVSELLENGFIDRDDTFDLVVIRDWWQHNTIENPKVAIGAMKAFNLLPQCPTLLAAFCDFSVLPEPLSKLFSEQYPNGIDIKKPEPSLSQAKPEPHSAPSAALVVKRETSNIRKKGTRLAIDAEPDEQDIRYAGGEYGWSAERIALEWSNMRDWSQSSRNGAKLDWRATWRTWVRRREGECANAQWKPTADRTATRRAAIYDALRDELPGNEAGTIDGDGAGEVDGLGTVDAEFDSAELGSNGETVRPEVLRSGNGQTPSLDKDDGDRDGRSRSDEAIPDDYRGLAGRSPANGHWTNDPDARLPLAAEASAHPGARLGGVGETEKRIDDGAGIDGADPLDIPDFLRRSA